MKISRIWVAPRSKHALVPNLGTGVSFLRKAFPVRGSLWRVFCRGGAEPRPYQNCAYFWGCSEICCGRIRSAQNWEQELLVFLRVHIFPRNEDAGNLNEIVGLLAVCHANGLLDGHVAHVEWPLRDNGLNDVLL